MRSLAIVRHLDFLRRALITRDQAALCRQRIVAILDPRRAAMFEHYASELDTRAALLDAQAEREREFA